MGFMEGNFDSEVDAATFIFPIAVACRLWPLSATYFRRHGVNTRSTGYEVGRALIAGYRRARLRHFSGLVHGDRLDLAFEQCHPESIPHHTTRHQGKKWSPTNRDDLSL